MCVFQNSQMKSSRSNDDAWFNVISGPQLKYTLITLTMLIVITILKEHFFRLCRDLNPDKLVYQTNALPNELKRNSFRRVGSKRLFVQTPVTYPLSTRNISLIFEFITSFACLTMNLTLQEKKTVLTWAPFVTDMIFLPLSVPTLDTIWAKE